MRQVPTVIPTVKHDKGNFCRVLHILCIVFSLAIIACRSSETPLDTVVVSIEKAPLSRHPVFASDAYSFWISELIAESLVTIGKDLTIQPQLAEKWSSPTPTSYRFVLKKGVSFHNGQPLTCQDIHASLMRYASTDSPFSGAFQRIKKSTCSQDGSEIEIHLKEPYAAFLTDLVTAKVFPESTLQEVVANTKTFVGTGPMRLVEADERHIKLETFDRHWGEKPSFKFILFQVTSDPQTRFLALKKGSVDLALNVLPPAQVEEARALPSLEVMSAPGVTFQYISMNHTHPELKKRDIRKAIAHGIDRESIIKQKLRDMATLTNSLLSKESYFFEADLPSYAYDPNKSRELLKAHGFTQEKPLVLNFKTSNDPQAVSLALIYKEQLNQVGIQLNVKSLEFATFFDDVKKGNFDLHSLRWVGVTEPNAYFDFLHTSNFAPKGRNRGYYSNSTLDSLAAKANVVVDPNKRKKLYSEIQKLAATDLPYINLWHMRNVAVFRKDRITNLELVPTGSYMCLLKIQKK